MTIDAKNLRFPLAKCGALGCNNIFIIKNPAQKPQIYICPACEDRINYGIKAFLHQHTGSINGNLNILERK